MWKAHKLAGKMRCSPIQYSQLTLTYSIFHMNCNTFLEFSQTLYQQFSTFHSTVVVNYPGQASFERNWMFLIAFLFLRAYWIVSAGPSGLLKQSIQKTVFEQRTTSIRWRALKSKKLFCNGPKIVEASFLWFQTVLLLRRRLNSDEYRKTYRKTLKYETTLDHARRP